MMYKLWELLFGMSATLEKCGDRHSGFLCADAPAGCAWWDGEPLHYLVAHYGPDTGDTRAGAAKYLIERIKGSKLIPCTVGNCEICEE